MNDGPDTAAGDGAPALIPTPAQLPLFPLPNPAPIPNRTSTVQDRTRRQHDANNLLFITFLFDVDAILVHEPYRLHFHEADQLDKMHPTTRASRANLKRVVRHALSTGIPIDLNRLPSNVFSYYVHSLVVRGDAFVGMAGTVRLRSMANSMRFLHSSAGIAMPPDANSSISRTIDRYTQCIKIKDFHYFIILYYICV